jgi:Lrp/AsnC family transcriptional regulator, leucine-responsive regulatory protein
MTFQAQRPLDDLDWRILGELQADGRLSYNELGRRVSLSPPAVADRAGFPLTAFVQMHCRADHCLLKTSQASDYPEVVEIHKLTGDYCSMLKVRAASMEHFEGLLERLGERHGVGRTTVVLSTQYEDRPVERRADDLPASTPSSGWARERRPTE